MRLDERIPKKRGWEKDERIPKMRGSGTIMRTSLCFFLPYSSKHIFVGPERSMSECDLGSSEFKVKWWPKKLCMYAPWQVKHNETVYIALTSFCKTFLAKKRAHPTPLKTTWSKEHWSKLNLDHHKWPEIRSWGFKPIAYKTLAV